MMARFCVCDGGCFVIWWLGFCFVIGDLVFVMYGIWWLGFCFVIGDLVFVMDGFWWLNLIKIIHF